MFTKVSYNCHKWGENKAFIWATEQVQSIRLLWKDTIVATQPSKMGEVYTAEE